MIQKIIFGVLLLAYTLYGSNFGTITTGGKDGTYIQIGNDIANVFQKYKINIKVATSEGSVDNLNRILGVDKQNVASWAIVQNDALSYYRFLHFKDFSEDLNDKVKSVLPLYNEDIHIFTRKGKEIKFESNQVMKVGIKSKKSGGFITAKIIENLYGVKFKFTYTDFETAQQYLQKGIIDIFIDVTAKPNSSYKNLQGIDFVELPQNKMMNKTYNETLFTKKDYPWIEKDSFGYTCPSVIVTSLVEPKYDKVVKIFTKAILKNYDQLTKTGHPKWKDVYQNLNSQIFNYHPQVAQSILEYQKNF